MKKIFLWETQSIIALDLMNVLKKSSFRVRRLRKNEDLDYITANEKPDLYILSTDEDVAMNNHLLSIINKHKIPSIILSAMPEQYFDYPTNTGAVKFLSKPYDNDSLILSINEIQTNAEKK
jgi:DNA-binding NtrC family response regulator